MLEALESALYYAIRDLNWQRKSRCLARSLVFRGERARVRRSEVEMRNRLLQPGNDLGNPPNGLFLQVTVHVVPKPDLDAGGPEPANAYVDFAVVDRLKLDGEIGRGLTD